MESKSRISLVKETEYGKTPSAPAEFILTTGDPRRGQTEEEVKEVRVTMTGVNGGSATYVITASANGTLPRELVELLDAMVRLQGWRANS